MGKKEDRLALKNAIDAVAANADSQWIVDVLREANKYLASKVKQAEEDIKSNPPSHTNIPSIYLLCDKAGKPFAKSVDGKIVEL